MWALHQWHKVMCCKAAGKKCPEAVHIFLDDPWNLFRICRIFYLVQFSSHSVILISCLLCSDFKLSHYCIHHVSLETKIVRSTYFILTKTNGNPQSNLHLDWTLNLSFWVFKMIIFIIPAEISYYNEISVLWRRH